MTINEIAEKANVSIGTVDRVIHNRGRVAPATVKKVKKIIKETGYEPNPIAKQLKLHKKLFIGLLLPKLTSESGYWNLVYEGIKKSVAELPSFYISFELKEFDRAIENDYYNACKKLIKKGVNYIITAPLVYDEVIRSHSENENIPFVFIDSPFPDIDSCFTVVQDPYQAGYAAGRMMDLLCSNLKEVVSVQVFSSVYNLKERAKGFAKYFEDNATSTKKVSVINAINTNIYSKNSDKKSLFLLLDKVLKEHSALDGIFITNDIVYEVANYFKAKKITKDIKVIGFDLIPQNIDGLKNNEIDCIISQSPEVQGYKAVQNLYRKEILLQETESMVSLPIYTFFKENICM